MMDLTIKDQVWRKNCKNHIGKTFLLYFYVKHLFVKVAHAQMFWAILDFRPSSNIPYNAIKKKLYSKEYKNCVSLENNLVYTLILENLHFKYVKLLFWTRL